MTAIDTSRAHYETNGLFSRIATAFVSSFAALAAWNDARVTRNALAKLSDRELEDIGLCRGDIEFVTLKR